MAEPALGTVHGRHLLPQSCREGAMHKLLKFNLLLAERIVKDTPVRDLGVCSKKPQNSRGAQDDLGHRHCEIFPEGHGVLITLEAPEAQCVIRM